VSVYFTADVSMPDPPSSARIGKILPADEADGLDEPYEIGNSTEVVLEIGYGLSVQTVKLMLVK